MKHISKAFARTAWLLTAVCLLLVPLPASAAGNLTVPYAPSSQYQSSVYYRNLKNVTLGSSMRSNLVNVALSQVGYHEGNSVSDLGGGNTGGGSDYTEYGYFYGTQVLGNRSGYFLPWCALFVTWCARMAGIPTDIIKSSPVASPIAFGVPYYAYKSGAGIQAGDLVFLQFGSSTGFDHVAIVYKVDSNYIYTVDGNYSRAVSNFARYYRSNGQDVYSASTRIGYYAVPDYTAADNTTVVDKGDPYGGFPAPERTLSYSGGTVMTGRDVSWVQYTLRELGYNLTVDGSYGPATANAVKTFRASYGLSANGITDADTVYAIKSMVELFVVIDTDPPPGYFVDVGENRWYYNAVQSVYVQGLFSGTGTYTFDPELTMSRAMFATVLWRIAGQPAAGSSGFSDVKDGQWYTTAVRWAAGAGILEGVSPDRFDPDGVITREQMAVILCRYVKKNGKSTAGTALTHTDAALVSSWARNAVEWAVNIGIITGKDDGTLCPKNGATRAEVAAVITRFVRLYGTEVGA